MSPLAVRRCFGPIDAVVDVPGSKSISNRAAIAAALAHGRSVLSNFLLAEDTERLIVGLSALGISMQTDRVENRVEVTGCAGHLPESAADLDCGESGTMLRLCTACCAAARGRYRLHGSGRLHQRPMGPLVEALRQLGAAIEFEQQEDHAPLIVHARGLRGGAIEVDGSLSSQFASAILLAAPLAASDVMLTITGQHVSEPYVRMTIEVMKAFDVQCITEDYRRIIVPAPQTYTATNYRIEPDASTAAYFLAAAAICGGRVRITGLTRASCQGDMRIADLLQHMGCRVTVGEDGIEVHRDPSGNSLRGVHADLGHVPDLVPTIAVLALFCSGPTWIGNVAHVEHKESKRLTVLDRELSRLGGRIERHSDGLTIHPPRCIGTCTIDPEGDHRIAMACALVGLVIDGISISDPHCVAKSCPNFFELLSSLTAPDKSEPSACGG